MADYRIHKTIRSRNDINVSRVVDPIRCRRRCATGLLCLVALLGAALLLLGSHRTFEARPVSPAHRLFEHDCAACHKQPFGTLGRLLPPDNGFRTVDDKACQRCHQEKKSRDHYAAMLRDDTQLKGAADCAECHHEHGTTAKLALVHDRHCTECHADLATVLQPGAKCTIEPKITSFADHPEFAIFRRNPGDPPKDPSNIEFNHSLHLHPDGLPHAQPGQFKKLSCTDCHEPDASGEYMQPIDFDRHCHECHKLDVFRDTQFAEFNPGEKSPLPHVSPEQIRGVLRGRLMEYARQNPAEIAPAQARNQLVPPMKSAEKPNSQDRWEWVETRLQQIEKLLFNAPGSEDQAHGIPGRPDRDDALRMLCSRCHKTVAQQGPPDALVTWKILEPEIPSRWLDGRTHQRVKPDAPNQPPEDQPDAPGQHRALVRFPHQLHGDLRCVDCHYLPTAGSGIFPAFSADDTRPLYPDLTVDGGPELKAFLKQTIYASKSSDDVLLPRIETCRKCHSDQPSLANATRGAPTKCMSCHDYHQSPEGNVHPDRPLPILTSELSAK